ncbi:MAG: thiamine pyrophosphate-dependent enzyme, partial [Gammaproteobacteria bacterium]
MFECLDAELTDEVAVIADPGDALFGANDLTIHSRTEFIGCAYYASRGFAVPGVTGIQMAQLQWRPLVLVGDGAFQMTGLETSTAARYGLTSALVILDNQGYGAQRPMLNGPFNDVRLWVMTEVTKLIGAGQPYSVHTETEFVAALRAALGDSSQLAILDVNLSADRSEEHT